MHVSLTGIPRSAGVLAVVAMCGLFSATVRADDYSLSDPVPDSDLRPFCTDRPTKNTGPCSIDAGHFQIESDIFNATFDHEDGVTTDTYVYTDPNLKLGLTDDTDVELSVAPFTQVDTHDQKTGTHETLSGFGDMFVHLKTNFAGNAGGDFGFAIDPFVKIPTAPNEIGNGAFEGGLPVPMQFGLSDTWSLSATPELDVLKDNVGEGHHASFQMPVGLTYAVSSTTTLSGEVWGNFNEDPSGNTNQYSVDFAATWQPPGTKDFQLDCGINFGLNKNTPATQAYVGVSKRW
jgi:Putative MetA-pathway of phenol degradation